MIQQEHNDLTEHRHYTAPDYSYEPTWIDREMSMLQWLEAQANEDET
jgi:hypothetical protein